MWENTLGSKISLDFKPIEGLKISANIAPGFVNYKAKQFTKKVPYYDWDDPTKVMGYLSTASKTSLFEYRNDSFSITGQLLASYNKEIGDHRLNIMTGYEEYYYTIENLGASRDQYDLDLFPYLDLGPITYRDNIGNAYELAYRSFYGRLIYSYKNKYLFQVNDRYDGSSRFDKEFRWGFFPSFSLGWIISEEPFMKSIHNLSHLKLRGSYGTLGNDRIGVYPYQSTVSFGSTLLNQGTSITSHQTSYISDYAIKDISWETTESYDIGLDAYFFNNRLSFSGDYYRKTTKDMLLALAIPDYIGFDNPDQNAGNMYTSGWDLELGWKDVINNLRYSVSFNLSDFKSIMGDLKGTEFLGSQVKMDGSEFNEWYGYLSDGIYQTQTEIDNSATINSTVSLGDIKYKDISGPDGVPDGVISPEYDRELLGGSLPRFLYGGNIQLDYKSIDFSLAFQGIGKQNVLLPPSWVSPRYAHYKLIDGNYWSNYNTVEQNKKAKYPRFLTSTENNYVTSDFWLFNGAYFRLKNITLGYTIPSHISQTINMKGIRFYITMSDLFSIDNYPSGYDPEGSGFFITKSFMVGASLNF